MRVGETHRKAGGLAVTVDRLTLTTPSAVQDRWRATLRIEMTHSDGRRTSRDVAYE